MPHRPCCPCHPRHYGPCVLDSTVTSSSTKKTAATCLDDDSWTLHLAVRSQSDEAPQRLPNPTQPS